MLKKLPFDEWDTAMTFVCQKICQTHSGSFSLGLILLSFLASSARSHEPTLAAFLARQKAANQSQDTIKPSGPLATVQLDIRDDAGQPIFAIARFIDVASGKQLQLNDVIRREKNWHVISPRDSLQLPQTKLKIEVVRGLDTEMVTRDVDLSGKSKSRIKVQLKRFYQPHKEGIVSGNTHLHLKKLSMRECIQYLQRVPKADGLDVLFVSHLLRKDDDQHYITNRLIEGDFGRLSQEGVTYGNGEEHRHNFSGFGEGYGHVMLLNIQRLIEPVSIGPGIMKSGTDGLPLRPGIKNAHSQKATVIWCHNKYGMEDVPNWLAGLIHAQNIFDGGNQGNYEETFYRYLNFGLRVPFSTGTDWFIYDFARVYVPKPGKPGVESWLEQLRKGRTFITNGPFLELKVNGKPIGTTIEMAKAGEVVVEARAVGRLPFKQLELVQDGKVVHTSSQRKVDGHYEAKFKMSLPTTKSSWLAIRIPPKNILNEFGRTLFAHTSPVYVNVARRPIRSPEIAQGMIKEIEANIDAIEANGKFANSQEKKRVLTVHHKALTYLRDYLKVNPGK